jgi:hypothetical protein
VRRSEPLLIRGVDSMWMHPDWSWRYFFWFLFLFLISLQTIPARRMKYNL